jgi:hypothetical protein
MGLVLVTVAGLYFFQGSEEFEEATYTLPATQLTIDPARIVRVDITRPAGFVRLERLRGEWKLTEPVFASIDQDRLRELQQGLAGFRLIGLVSTNPRKQRVLQVDEQGTGVVLVGDDGRSLSLVVGKAAPTRGNAFIRPALSDTVYLAHGLTPAIINRDVIDWRLRTVLRLSPDAVHGLTITSGSGRHILEKREQAWASKSGPVSSELMNAALNALTGLQASAFVDTSMMIRNRPRYDLDVAAEPPLHLELYSLGAADTNYLLKTSLSSAIVVVPPALVRGLDRIVASIAPPPPPPVVRTVTPAPQPPVAGTTTGRVNPPAATVNRPAVPDRVPAVTDRRMPGSAQPQPGSRRQPARRPDAVTKQLEDSGNLTVHIVKRGESIISIARKYGVAVDQLKQWNGLQGENVVPGMEMYVFVKPAR